MERARVRETVADYMAVMNPFHCGDPLSRAQCCRLLPLSTFMQMLCAFIFFVVEVSGGAGGTIMVASTRTVLKLLVYMMLCAVALLISSSSAKGTLNPNTLLFYGIFASLMLAVMLGSSLSTFGVESCGVSAAVEPVSQNLPPEPSLMTPQQKTQNTSPVPSSTPPPSTGSSSLKLTSCGIDSPRRGAKIVFEFLLSLVFGLPTLITAFIAATAATYNTTEAVICTNNRAARRGRQLQQPGL